MLPAAGVSATGRYFAYGSNLDPDQMRRRCPGAALEGLARLSGHRFLITGRGYASVVPDPNAEVWGVLWSLTPEDEEALDTYEGVARGLYRKAVVSVQPGGAGPDTAAMMYVAAQNQPGRPRPGYLEGILRAADYHGLPPGYRAQLRRWLTGPPPEP